MRTLSLFPAVLLAACAPQGDGTGDSGSNGPNGSVEQRSDAPPHPAADPALAKVYRAWQAKHALPAVELEPAGPAKATPGGTRIGGPAWLAAGERWPTGRDGKPMTFIAQVDFAELPPLPDYPETGVLQFFIAHDAAFGADFQHPERGDFRVVWRPAFGNGGRMAANVPHLEPVPGLGSPLEAATAATGVALRPRAAAGTPTFNSWLFARDFADLYRRNGWGRLSALLGASPHHATERHHVGGHPEFVQDDWRMFAVRYQRADRVLLNLWSDNTLMWGDMGQGQFLISREDLLKRDFGRVYYQWDSS